MEKLILDVENLYTVFGSGFVIGFFLSLSVSVISLVIEMGKGLFKQAN